MKILLVSDSHGNNEAINMLLKQYPNMDLYIHCGDSESDEFSLYPYRSVMGNCDLAYDFPHHLIIPTPYGNMLVQHKPNPDADLLRSNHIKVFAYGHTHVRKYSEEFGIVCINPGSISFARDKYDGSYAIVTITEKKVEVEFHTLEETISKE